MSAPVSIPRRTGGRGARGSGGAGAGAAAGPGHHSSSSPSLSTAMSTSMSSSSASSSYTSTLSNDGSSPAVPSPLRQVAGLGAHDDLPVSRTERRDQRRMSLMSSSLAASEHTVINVGGPDGPPRLISCVRSSQGFDWNQEIFLPSQYDHLFSDDLERRRDPVHDIVLTDEETYGIFPQ